MRSVLYYFLLLIGIPIILGTALSILPAEPFTWAGIFDFPRQQFLIISLILLPLLWWVTKRWSVDRILFLSGLLFITLVQCWYLFPYTPLAEKEVLSVSTEELPDAPSFGLLVANVQIQNRQSKELLDIIEHLDPDMILAIETDRWWDEQLQSLDRHYPYSMKHLLDNGYGMILYSRLPLSDKSIRFLNYPSVPSFHAQVHLPGGERFQFHGMHPVPPLSERSMAGDAKEMALKNVGEMVDSLSLPAVVAGDMNDVAWVRDDDLFHQDGLMKDVRVGRGIYSTYDAENPIIRWPLDYLFVTGQFQVSEFHRPRSFGSDHFPIYGRFHLVRDRDTGSER